MLKVGGVAYAIFSLTQIHSLNDLGAFVAAWGVTLAIARVATAARIGSGAAFVITMVIGMKSDQAEPSEDQKRWNQVELFMQEHFTWDEIQKNYNLRYEVYNLLFIAKPFEIVPSLQETINTSFERCMNQEATPVAAGTEAAEERRTEALEKCSLQTGYRAEH